MMHPVRNERGLALPAAMLALVLIGALVAGALYAGNQEQRVAENVRRANQSFGVAEAGLAEVVRTWDPDLINQRGTYPTDSVRVNDVQSPAATGSYGGYVYKLNSNLYLVDVTGNDAVSRSGVIGGGGARQRLGLITRVKPIQMNIQASLTTQGSVSVSGSAEIDGNDQNPLGWTDCSAPDSNMAGVRDRGGTVATSGTGDVDGNPPVWNDPTVNDSTFTNYGDMNFATLAASATVQLPGGLYSTAPEVVGTACDKTVLTNWGDGMNKLAPCANYWPIIYINGDVTLNGVQGQGILLVNGSLTVQGSYQFFGIVIVLGDLKTAGGGSTEAHFWGGVMARNADLSVQSLSGHATLNYSKCAITKALQNTSVTASLRSRGWVQLF